MSVSECAKHCSLCYNETDCYECTQGFFLSATGECERECGVILVWTFYHSGYPD